MFELLKNSNYELNIRITLNYQLKIPKTIDKGEKSKNLDLLLFGESVPGQEPHYTNSNWLNGSDGIG